MADTDKRILLTKEEADRKAEEKSAAIGIEFYNVNSGERRVATTSEHIAAFFNSSDEGPNAKNHQDMGWRLAPEDLIEMERIQQDSQLMAQIAAINALPPDEVAPYNVLKYMAGERFKQAKIQAQAEGKSYESEYEREVRKLREGNKEVPSKKNTPASAPQPRKVNRDAGDGQFVSNEEAAADPDGTVTETVPQAQKPVANKPEKADNGAKNKQ